MTRILQIVSGMLLYAAACNMQAAVTTATTSPSSANVPVNRTVSISVNWLATSNTAGAITVSSSLAEYRTPGGQVLMIRNKSVSRSINGPGTASIRESVLVPNSLVKRSLKMGYNRIIYRRNFDDGGGASSADMIFYFAPTGAASFAISKITLRFDNKEPVLFLKKGKKHRATAEISVVGSGLIKGSWEVARPNVVDKEGKPLFVVIKQVARYYKSSSRPHRLKSPVLPADVYGQHQVRFRIQKPATGFETPVVRYNVTK